MTSRTQAVRADFPDKGREIIVEPNEVPDPTPRELPAETPSEAPAPTPARTPEEVPA